MIAATTAKEALTLPTPAVGSVGTKSKTETSLMNQLGTAERSAALFAVGLELLHLYGQSSGQDDADRLPVLVRPELVGQLKAVASKDTASACAEQLLRLDDYWLASSVLVWEHSLIANHQITTVSGYAVRDLAAGASALVANLPGFEERLMRIMQEIMEVS